MCIYSGYHPRHRRRIKARATLIKDMCNNPHDHACHAAAAGISLMPSCQLHQAPRAAVIGMAAWPENGDRSRPAAAGMHVTVARPLRLRRPRKRPLRVGERRNWPPAGREGKDQGSLVLCSAPPSGTAMLEQSSSSRRLVRAQRVPWRGAIPIRIDGPHAQLLMGLIMNPAEERAHRGWRYYTCLLARQLFFFAELFFCSWRSA